MNVMETVTLSLILGAGATVLTIALFASGLLYSKPAVDRLVAQLETEIVRCREDTDYYRMASQSCAAAVAHLEGQLRVARALLDSGGNGVG